MDEVSVEGYPKPLTNLEMILQSIEKTGEQNILAGTPFKGIAEAFSGWNSSHTGKVYARMPYEIVIR